MTNEFFEINVSKNAENTVKQQRSNNDEISLPSKNKIYL